MQPDESLRPVAMFIRCTSSLIMKQGRHLAALFVMQIVEMCLGYSSAALAASSKASVYDELCTPLLPSSKTMRM